MAKQINQSIVIDAKIKATLEGMEQVVSKLNQGLREGTTKVDLTKGIGASLSKYIEKFKDEFSKFSKLTEGGKVEFGDSKEAIRSGETLIKTFRELKRIVGDFDDLSILDAKRLFPDAFESKVGELLKGLNSLSVAMGKLETKRLDLSSAKTELDALRAKADDFQTKMSQEITAKTNFDQAQEELRIIDEEISKIRKKASEGISLKIEASKKELSEAEIKRQQIEEARVARGFSSADFIGSKANNPQYRGKTISAWTRQFEAKNGSAESKAEAEAALRAIRLYHQEEEALVGLSRAISDKIAEVKRLEEALEQVDKMKLTEAVEIGGGSEQEKKNAQAAEQMRAKAAEAEKSAAAAHRIAATQAKGAKEGYDRTSASIEEQRKKIDKLKIEVADLEKEVSPEALEKAFSAAGVEGFNAEMLKSREGIEQLREKLNALDQEKLDELKKQFINMGLSSDQAEEYIKQLRGTVDGIGDSALDIKKAADEIDNLKNSVLQFFSLTNAVQLFKRAVTSAMNTVKELDATMTEAAVVTEFDIGDMWDRLPEYSANAQKLGVSINGMYQATTLYYQQGLKNNEAMQLGIETMKMGKIASMDSTEATKAMTAALRGFNMELNETSATKVNDVYSQLAAVTAADTNQIATAMEKTASIAASANMEFETTAALLAQIIETTQEAPETAGTALKTIIARFSEVKDLKNQGLTTGQDEEGEAIDVNKIQTALRSVGISMEGFFNGTEGLDSIFLKLSQKWSTLDFEAQRYIATMAAGSRQQSRFIAMMSDYGRTTELVSEAQNSAGASQRQFEKTQDSLASSLQKSKNAWDQFLMGLSNNEVLKFAVDSLTAILTTINKITEGISGENGLIKSVVSLTTVLGGLSLGKAILPSIMETLGGIIGIGPKIQTTVEGVDEKGNKTYTTTTQRQTSRSGDAISQSGIGGARARAAESRKQNSQNKGIKGWLGDRGRNIGAAFTMESESRRQASEQGAGIAYIKKIKKKYKGGFDEEGLKSLEEAYQKTLESSGSVEQALDAVDNKAIELNESYTALGNKSDYIAKGAKKIVVDFGAVGQVFMGAGTAVGAFAALLSSLGLEEEAEGLSKISTILFGIGAAAQFVLPILSKGADILTAKGVQVQLAWFWVTLIAAAIAALITGFIAIKKTLEMKDETKQLEKLQEKLDEVSDAANRTKEELEGIASAREGLEEMGKTLDSLTRGTSEWREALIKNNDEVLSLIDTYPELSEWLTRGMNGELVIRQEGLDKLEENKLNQYAANITAKAVLNNDISRKNQEINTKHMLERESGLGEVRTLASIVGAEDHVEKAQTGGLTYEDFNKFVDAIAGSEYLASDLTLTKNAVIKGLEEARIPTQELDIDKFQNSLIGMGAEFDKLTAAAMAAEEAERARMAATIDSVAATSELVMSSEKFAEVVKQATTELNKDYSENITQEAEKMIITLNSKNNDAAINQIYSDYAKIVGSGDAESIRKKVESGELSKTDIAYTVTANKENEKQVNAMETLTQTLENINKIDEKKGTRLKELLGEKGGQLSIQTLTELGYLNDSGERVEDFTIDNLYEKLGLTEKDIIDLQQGLKLESQKELADYLNQQMDMGYRNYQDALDSLAFRGVDVNSKSVTGLTSEAARGIAKNIEEAVGREKGADEINNVLSQIQEFLDGQNVDENTRAFLLESLASADWDSVEELNQVAATWTSELGENGEATRNLLNGIIALTNATENLTQVQLNERAFTARDIIEKLTTGELKQSNLDEKIKEQIVNILGPGAASSFVSTGMGTYTYVGQDLISALLDKTNESEKRSKELKNWIDNYNTQIAFSSYLNKTNGKDINFQYSKEAFDQVMSESDNSFIWYSKGIAEDVADARRDGKEDTEYTIASQERIYFNELVGKYLQGDSTVSFEDIWRKYSGYSGTDLDNLGLTKGMTQEGLQAELNNKRAQVANAATSLGQEGFTSYSAYTGNTRLEEYNDIIANKGILIAAAKSGERESLNSVFRAYSNMAHAVGEDWSGNLSVQEMIAEMERMYSQYGTGQFAKPTEETVQQYGAGVAATAGMASTYNREVGDNENLQGMLDESYWKTIEAMRAYLGAEAFDSEIAKITEGFGELSGKIEDVNGVALDYDQVQKVFSVDAAQAYKRIKNLIEGFSDYKDVLIEGNRELPEYAEALDSVKTALATTFQVDKSVIEKMFEEGLITQEQIEDLVAGKDGAFKGISDAIKTSMLQGVAAAGTEIDPIQVQGIISLEGQLNEEQLQGILNTLGYDLDAASEKGRETLAGIFSAVQKSVAFNIIRDKNGDITGIDAVVSDTVDENVYNKVLTTTHSGGSSSGSKKYENSHDKFYNQYEKINALLREREKIERRYDKLLKKRSITGKELINESQKELVNLEAERKLQEEVQRGKLNQIEELMSKNSKYNKYVTGFDKKTGAISINWDEFEKIKNSDRGAEIDEYLSKLEEFREQWQEAQDSIDNIDDTTEEIRDRGKDEYFDLEDKIKDALVNIEQKKIDQLSEINDSINDTNGKILESMQEQINAYRQNRDNQKTEEELSDKQRRLAYLSQDTSGANATEILQLQKELKEGQESYTDQLIDQKISELQKQNDKAAEQRERQISILDDQLAYYQSSGALWTDVYKLLDEGYTEEGGINRDSALAKLLQESEEFSSLSNLGKKEWWGEIAQTFANAFQYINGGRRAEENETISFKTADNVKLSGKADANGNIITEEGTTYQKVHQNAQGDWFTSEQYQQPGQESESEANTWPYSWPKPSTGSSNLRRGSTGSRVKGLQQALNDLGFQAGAVDGIFGANTEKAVRAFQAAAKQNNWNSDIGSPDGIVGPKTRKAFAFKEYKTGGLADFTGPAWLDGTKSKPEYILNADQTKAFFNLVDVLSSLQSGTSKTTQNSGDNTYDIDINVESIGSDYDVEQLANTVKRLINEDARYRNNNAINLMR